MAGTYRAAPMTSSSVCGWNGYPVMCHMTFIYYHQLWSVWLSGPGRDRSALMSTNVSARNT